MSKKNTNTGNSNKSKGKSKVNNFEIEINPSIIRFTHSRIRSQFTGCNKRIEETINEIIQQKLHISNLPLITVLYIHNEYYSLNNRRLYVIKYIQELGLLPNNMITIRLKQPLEREIERYNPTRCSLTATIMKEYSITHNTSEAILDDNEDKDEES